MVFCHVLQYLLFFPAGLYVSKYGMEKKPVRLIVSGVLTAASVVYTIIWGEYDVSRPRCCG